MMGIREITRKWNLPLTYSPKINPVKRGECHQTIRPGTKKRVGDLVRFYVWMGRPYHSKRETIAEYAPLTEVWEIDITPLGINFYNFDGRFEKFESWELLDWLAARDGIVPPTGETLRDVLMSKNKIPEAGVEAQILRWS
jgi:hypothetical protein